MFQLIQGWGRDCLEPVSCTVQMLPYTFAIAYVLGVDVTCCTKEVRNMLGLGASMRVMSHRDNEIQSIAFEKGGASGETN